jgi:hypothetical protein
MELPFKAHLNKALMVDLFMVDLVMEDMEEGFRKLLSKLSNNHHTDHYHHDHQGMEEEDLLLVTRLNPRCLDHP